MSRRQGIFWLLTVPADEYEPVEDPRCQWIKGQQEVGSETGFRHWQICIALRKKGSLRQVKEVFGNSCHAELSRSEAASDYVWKEDTRVEGTQFEFGVRPIARNSRPDWESVWTAAKSGDLDAIPPPRYEFVVIGPFEQLVLIIHEQDQWRENVLYSGAKLDLESPGVLGKKPEWKLTAKIPERSFGTVTKWRRMLSSMSFEEELTLPISCAGSTVIQSEWRSKAPVVPWLQGSSGSPPISVQTNGILNAI